MSQTPTSMSPAFSPSRSAKRTRDVPYFLPEDNKFLETVERSNRRRQKIRRIQRMKHTTEMELRELKDEVKALQEELQDPWAQYHGILQANKELQSDLRVKDSQLNEFKQQLKTQLGEAADEVLSTKHDMDESQYDRNLAMAELERLSTKLRDDTFYFKTQENNACAEQKRLHTQLQESASSLKTVEGEQDSAHAEQKRLQTQLQESASSLKTVEGERDWAKVALQQKTSPLRTFETKQDLVQNEPWGRAVFPETAEAVFNLGQEDMEKLFGHQGFQHQISSPSMDWSDRAPQNLQYGWVDYSIMGVQEPTNDFQLNWNFAG